MKFSKIQPSGSRGFALVVTLALMILLTVIAVGLLTLSAVNLRATSRDSAQAEARSNARMALMLAIGELQKHTGPDTRITASSGLVDPASPPLTGVWRSWEGSDHNARGTPIGPDYTAKTKSEDTNGRFLMWLVSGAKQGVVPTDAGTLAFKKAGAATIPLLSTGTLGAENDQQVHLVPQLLKSSAAAAVNQLNGSYAWWVSGENQKACLAQPYKPRTGDVAGSAEMGQSHTITNPEDFGLSSLLSDPELHNPNAAAAKPARKALSRQTMALIETGNAAEPQKKFHDLTSYSIGLLTNAATGGWRKDLSLLTEKWDSIYSGYPGGKLPLFRFTPNAGATSKVPKPTTSTYDPAQSNLYPWSEYSLILGYKTPSSYHAASASWASLVSFATSYKNFSNSSGTVTSPFVWDVMATQRASNVGNQQFFNYKHKQRLYPQIARFQFVVYVRAVEDPARMNQNPKRYQLEYLYAPFYTLWNPYNVSLEHTIKGTLNAGQGSGQEKNFLGFGWRRSPPGVMAAVNQATYPNPDLVPSNQYQLFTPGNFQTLDSPSNNANPYDWQLPGNSAKGYGRRVDKRTFGCWLPEGKLAFKPGEVKIFSPEWSDPAYGLSGVLRLKEGYNPKTIVGSDFKSTSNLLANQSYWFLMKTDNVTQPFKDRDPGIGFSLSFGPGSSHFGSGGTMPTGVGENEYHNLTMLASEANGNAYWPPAEVDEVGYSIGELASGPWTPLFSISFGPRTTIGTGTGTKQNRPTKGVLQSNPLASMALNDPGSKDSKEHPANGTFDITYHSLSIGSTLTPNLSTSKGYIATGYQSGDGLSRLIMCDIPLRPMASIVELMGWNPRGNNPYPPFQHNLIGNSDATPLIPKDNIVPPVMSPATPQTNLQHDDAYCANHLLFDDWFVSSVAPQPYTFGGSITKDIKTFYLDYLNGDEQLTNRAYQKILADTGLAKSGVTEALKILDSNDGWLKIGSRFEVEGMFNVNSTSVDAWKALLGHAKSLDQIAMQGAGEIVSTDVTKKHVVTRGPIATDVEAGTGAGFGGQFANASEYAGFRSLSDDQIKDLAVKVVGQIRLRGPFLSLSEFVNRQLSGNKDLALAGAIQSALDKLAEDPMAVIRNPANSLSDTTMSPRDPKLSGVGYAFPEAAVGGSAYGAPGWIRQADILRPIAPILSARDDTFTIRAYGDSLDRNGKVVARAWCEAVVKRTREFSDNSDAPDSIEPPANKVNTMFGRRYEMVSFRWLNSNEV
jgi:hypothetical protein